MHYGERHPARYKRLPYLPFRAAGGPVSGRALGSVKRLRQATRQRPALPSFSGRAGQTGLGKMASLKFKRLPARYATLLLPLILSILMSGLVSLIATLHGVGAVEGFLGIWLGAWRVSWLIAFPSLLVVLPIVRRIVGLLVEPAN